MGTTQFPRIESPPVNPDLRALAQYVAQVANQFAVLSKNLDFLLNGSLDVQNVRARSLTAETLDVDELSAISANLGTMTAGEIYGALIATAVAGTYPRIEFSSADNLLKAQGNADESILIDPSVDGTPQMFFRDTSTGELVSIFLSSSIFIIVTQSGTDISIAAGKDLNLQSGDGYHTTVQDWDKLYSIGDSQNLQEALDAKAAAFTGFTGSFSTGTQTVTVVNGIITAVV